MSRASQKHRTRQHVSESTSLKLVKNMFRISVSTICWLRNLFDESVFVDLDHKCGTKFKQLRPSYVDENNLTVRHPEADRLMKWLEKGVFDALVQGYLKTMVFSIYEGSSQDDASRLIETYMYKVRATRSILTFKRMVLVHHISFCLIHHNILCRVIGDVSRVRNVQN